VRRDLAEAAQRYLDRLAQDPAASEAVRLDVIEGLRRLAQVQASPGSPSVANEHVARRNLERAEALASVLPADAGNPGERALTLGRIALARGRLEGSLEEDFPAAHRSLDRAAALFEEARQATPANAEVPILQSEVVAERADVLLWQGKYAESIEVARAALAKLDSAPASPSARPREIERADSLNRTRLLDAFAESHYYTEDYAAAERAYREELDVVARARAKEPDDLPLARRFMRAEWALAENLLADHLRPENTAETAKAVEAERLLADAVSIADTLQLFEPHDRDLARTAIVMLTAHARALSALKRFPQALPLLERSVAMRRQLWAETPSDWGLARDYAMGMSSLAGGRADAHQIAGACAAYAETLATLDRIRAAGHLAKLDEDHLTRLAREAQTRICH
jgi:tetratricopeptide (TPR) repeat protein